MEEDAPEAKRQRTEAVSANAANRAADQEYKRFSFRAKATMRQTGYFARA